MGPVEVRLLGPLEVDVAGRTVELRRKKQRSLLALLALRAGEVVSTDRLVEELWGADPPKAAVGSLQNLVSELRKALAPDLLATRSPGYMLELSPERVDVHRFQRLVAEADASSRADARSAKLREALALWRGPPLGDFAYEPFAQNEIVRLEELRAAAREDLIDAGLELGRHAQLVGELEALVAEHPLRERPRGLLMLALYRAGRQADALEAYRQARETLVEELGIDPSPELQRLEAAILRHDADLDLPRPAGPRRASLPREVDRRKTVTILFADVVDSSGLGAQLDPEVLGSVMRRYFEAVQAVVERHGGTVEKFIGDAVMAAFGIPTVHEDDALRAIRAASELRDSLSELNAELGNERGVVLQVRTGINTGEVLAADPGTGQAFATGSAVTVAMRIQQAALPGEILLGEATQRLVRGAVEAEPVEPLDLGGALGRVAAFRLLGVGDAARPLGGAPLVGRDEELALLRAAFEHVRDNGVSRVVSVLGEAGVGKTRLAAELASVLADEANVLVGRCLSYGEGATYLPLAEIVRSAVPKRPQRTIASLLAGDEHAELIAERVTQLSARSEGTASTGEVFWAVRRFLEALAGEAPLVVVLEDVHWAEPTLLDLIEYLGAWVADAPLLVLCLARPELLEERPGWGSDGAVVRLKPLGHAEAELLVGQLEGAELESKTRARIVEVAEGNPLFLEQLLAVVEEAGAEAIASVPPSVEALLAGRLDRLEPEERALLERAAVAGREFSRSAVVHLSPPAELAGVDGRLLTLVRRGLVHATRSRTERQDAFRFHHVLIRDVAYAGITKEGRADLHERFAAWLEQREEGAEEIVGYHLEQAHRYRSELRPGDPALPELAARAGEKLASAGIRSWRRADTAATVNLLGRAAVLRPARAELFCELGIAQRMAGDAEAGEQTLERAVVAASSENDRAVALRARVELAHARLFTDAESSSSELVDLAMTAIPIFEELGDDRALGRTWRHLGSVHGSFRGSMKGWQECVERALVHYRKSGWSTSGCLEELAAALFYGPFPVDAAIERCHELLVEAGERIGIAYVEVYLGGLEALAGRFDEARSLFMSAENTLLDLGETYPLANAGWRVRGRVELLAGDYPAAEHILRECCTTFERVGDSAALATTAAQLAGALYKEDRFEEASDWAGIAEAQAPRDDVSSQFWWRSVRAKLLARAGDLGPGEGLARDALRIVAETDALTEHGHVLLDFAEILQLGGKAAEASRRAEEALNLFERKGDAASTSAARAVLAELTLA